MKTLVVISDLHCGHLLGLCPPSYRSPDKEIRRFQVKAWNNYLSFIKKYGEPDVLLVNGDTMDGTGKAEGGRGVWSTDMYQQSRAAIECIAKWKAKDIIMTKGTPYHVGKDVDYEAFIADNVGAKLFDRAKFSINGLTFDARHTIGSSQIPHGRYTALAKEAMWNSLWKEKGNAPVDVVIRSHVHYFGYVGNPNFLALTTPALQAAGSSYGRKFCSGLVDWGIVIFNIEEDGRYSWEAEIAKKGIYKEKILEL